MRSLSGEDLLTSVGRGKRTTTVTDKPTRKVVGEPYRGETDVRFDEGTDGMKVGESD